MDTKFQTSFIPKKPLISENKVSIKGPGTSIFMFVGIIIFIISIAAAVYSVLWKSVLIKEQETKRALLVKSEERFKTGLIEDLKKVNTKIDLVKDVLNKHLSVSEIFTMINRLTIEGVRFTNFEFSAPKKDTDDIMITLNGVSNNFSSIAFQSDVFGKSEKYGTNKILKNPVISGLAINTNGTIGFTVTAMITPVDITYKKILNDELHPDGANQASPAAETP